MQETLANIFHQWANETVYKSNLSLSKEKQVPLKKENPKDLMRIQIINNY